MMTGCLHALQIVTLSTWLSVVGFGTLGLAIQGREPFRPQAAEALEVGLMPESIVLGDNASESGAGIPTPELPSKTLPLPPELPALAETQSLPELPELLKPQPGIEKTPAAIPAISVSPRATRAVSGKITSAPTGGDHGPGASGSGMSNADRIATGHMPSPDYPSYSRKNRQEGTVVVEFTVDSSGKVISAHAKHPCQWDLLNTEAVGTVRAWRFPPGGVMILQRPIVFQLR